MRRLIILALCLSLVMLCAAPALAAEIIDYGDFVSDITVDGDNDLVQVEFPSSYTRWGLFITGQATQNFTGPVVSWEYSASANLGCYPIGGSTTRLLDLADIPDGTNITWTFAADNIGVDINSPVVNLDIYYYDSDGAYLKQQNFSLGTFTSGTEFSKLFTLSKPDDAAYCNFRVFIGAIKAASGTGTISFQLKSFSMEFSISSAYREQQQTGKTNKLLQQVEKQLKENGQTLEDILKQQEQNGNKLDDMNQNIETLPGQIGDQIQGIIDSEQNKAEQEGNESVGEIIDVIPDPSADLLASLRKLSDVLTYNGTACVITMPAIKIPAIGALVPEMTLLEPQDVNFEDWFQKLPKNILSLIMALFDIAVVGFCGKEILGLIAAFAGGIQDVARETEE